MREKKTNKKAIYKVNIMIRIAKKVAMLLRGSLGAALRGFVEQQAA
jgi:hypothetical protein